jgi:hypothetical protein
VGDFVSSGLPKNSSRVLVVVMRLLMRFPSFCLVSPCDVAQTSKPPKGELKFHGQSALLPGAVQDLGKPHSFAVWNRNQPRDSQISMQAQSDKGELSAADAHSDFCGARSIALVWWCAPT